MAVEQDIRRLDITMDVLLSMDEIKRLGDLEQPVRKRAGGMAADSPPGPDARSGP